MIKIEKKFVKSKPFYYLTEQVNTGKKFKKIQVYIGKNIPNDLRLFYDALCEKEILLISDNLKSLYKLDKSITIAEYEKVEISRLRFKYFFSQLSDSKKELFWRDFAIKFIFESNAIEGSKLSQDEVEAIIKKHRLKAGVNRKEVIEVKNSIQVFELIRSADFKINQRSIINLHRILVDGLEIQSGYKKEGVVVNNKLTVEPGCVRNSVAELLKWWKEQKKCNEHPLIIAAEFHQRFERIHPFSDGNGRTGRLLFNWMLLRAGFGMILFQNKNRKAYFSALDQADDGRPGKLYRHCFEVYKSTIKEFLEV